MLYDLKYLTDIRYQKALKQFIEHQTRPFYESATLKEVYQLDNTHELLPIELYRYHFALFYMMYKLQDHYYKEDRYLHVHFMRSFLSNYPSAGHCREYDEQKGLFCNAPTAPDSSYCEFHNKTIELNKIESISIKYFYYSEDNFYKLNETDAEAFLNGTWELLYNYDEFKKAVTLLGLPENCTMEMVKTNYRKLAKENHPDLNSTTVNEDFIKINDAYTVLKRLLPIIRR